MSDTGLSTAELRESVRDLLEAESPLTLVRLDREARRESLTALWKRMASLGWFGLAVAEEHGGLGLRYRHLALLYEELGRHLTPLPVMSTLLAAHAIALAGSEAQQRRWLPQFAAGEVHACVALPTASLALPCLNPDGSIVGALGGLPNGEEVDEFLIPLQDIYGGIHLGIFHRGMMGVTITPRPLIDLSRTLADVVFHGAVLEDNRLMPIDAGGWTAVLDHACLALASDAVGGATRILTDTVTYLGERRQFDRPIGSFQALKHRAASWKIDVEGITALGRHCGELMDDVEPGRSGLVSAAKARSTEIYVQVAGDAVQLHGGIGFTWEHECHLFLKRATLDAALFGGILQHKDRAAHLSFSGSLRPRVLEHETLRRFFHG
jgi:alkylation response protein AidB-like acyl-CoA dehydrogenase